MSNKDWTDKLPDLLDNYTEAEPEGLWDAVQAGLVPQKRRIAAAWWYTGGGILAAAAVALFVFLRPTTPEATKVTVVPGDIVAEAPGQDLVFHEDTPDTPITQEPATSVPVIPVPATQTPDAQVPETQGPDIPATDIQTPDTTSPETQTTDNPTPETVTPEPETLATDTKTPDTPVSIKEGAPEPSAGKKPVPIKVQISLSRTGFMGQMAQNSTTGVGLPSTPGLRPDAVPVTKSSSVGGGASSVPMMLSRNKASTTDAKHTQSARLALGVRVGITERWGVESGLVSSTLTSEFTSNAGNSTDYTTRTIKYLGIPLYASYILFQTNRLGLTLNAGPMYEFSTKTSTTKLSYIGDSFTGRTADDTLYEDSKWSANVGAAFQLRVGKHGALYVQPGFSYHFPDNSALETFYTAHPAAFSFTFGYNILL